MCATKVTHQKCITPLLPHKLNSQFYTLTGKAYESGAYIFNEKKKMYTSPIQKCKTKYSICVVILVYHEKMKKSIYLVYRASPLQSYRHRKRAIRESPLLFALCVLHFALIFYCSYRVHGLRNGLVCLRGRKLRGFGYQCIFDNCNGTSPCY